MDNITTIIAIIEIGLITAVCLAGCWLLHQTGHPHGRDVRRHVSLPKE